MQVNFPLLLYNISGHVHAGVHAGVEGFIDSWRAAP